MYLTSAAFVFAGFLLLPFLKLSMIRDY
jgi:hypothetical protein